MPASQFEMENACYPVPIAAGQNVVPVFKLNTAGTGDVVVGALVTVANPVTSQVLLRDSATGTDITVCGVNQPVGTFYFPLVWRAVAAAPAPPAANNSGWYATTGAGASVVFTGKFR